MWRIVVVVVAIIGLLWRIYVVYSDIHQYQVLQRKLRKKRERVKENGIE